MSGTRAVVLSHTVMYGGFCTNVAFRDRHDDLRQVRILRSGGKTLTYASLSYSREEILERWHPKRIVILPLIRRGNPRPTHPEDRVLTVGRIRLTDDVATDQEYNEIVEAFSFPWIDELFTDMEVKNRKGYVASTHRLQRSVGYVRGCNVIFGQFETATINDGRCSLQCKVKCVGLLAELNSGQRRVGERLRGATIRLGLAGPYSGSNGDFNPPRCYIMLTGIV